MDQDKKEKLSLLTELIKFAKSDSDLREEERMFLWAIAQQLGIGQEEFETLFDTYISFTPPKMEFDRIVQFQRLVLLMNIDLEQKLIEFQKIREFGLRLGLSPGAIDEVLKAMDSYENRVIPPEKLISIFQVYYN